MKIIKIGTYNETGYPRGWHVGTLDPSDENRYVLGILDDKVFVNGIEIVEWTEKRRAIMRGDLLPEPEGE